MNALRRSPWGWLLAAALVVQQAAAQPRDAWQACLKEPGRSCVLAEALARMRDDAPPTGDARHADWERLLYLRMSAIAAATRSSALFDAARRSAEANRDPKSRRSALRWVAAAQARAGSPDDAVRTLEAGDDGGFAIEEIALANARQGRTAEAMDAVGRFASAEARNRTLARLAQETRDPRYLEHALDRLQGLEDGYEQSALRPVIAAAYARLGRTENAQKVVRGIAVSYHRAQALAEIARQTRDPRLLSEARRYAVGFDGREHEDEVWAAIARAEVELDVLAGARRTLETSLAKGPSRALAAVVGELAFRYWLNGERAAGEQMIDALLSGSWTIGEARAVLARRLIEAGLYDDARQVSFLADEITFDNLAAEIALKQAQSGAFADALQTANTIQHPARRSPTLAEIAALLPQ